MLLQAGTFHSVHCARLWEERWVVKFGFNARDCTLEVYLFQLAATHRATQWAAKFNSACQQAGLSNSIEYSEIRVASLPERGSHVLVEPFMEGDFVKWNDNNGGVIEDLDEAQAWL